MTGAGDGVRLFVRADDVGSLTEPLRRFALTFLERRIPVSYQIIPAKLTVECAAWLRSLWLNHPDLLEFGQHGLAHEMTLRGRRLLREFGPERSLSEQTAIVSEGRRRLEDLMGREVQIRVFTPPQHKYDRNTIRAIAAADYRILSAAAYASRHHQLAYAIGRRLGLSSIRHHGISYHQRQRPEAKVREISISVAVDNGKRICIPPAKLAAAIARASDKTCSVGLMFHHDVYEGHSVQLTALADELARLGIGRYRLLSGLADDVDVGSVPELGGRRIGKAGAKGD